MKQRNSQNMGHGKRLVALAPFALMMTLVSALELDQDWITEGSNGVACDLLGKEDLDCTACVDPVLIVNNEEPCEWGGNTADVEAEIEALEPQKLWKDTAFLFEDDANVWEVEFNLPKESWAALVDHPGAEEYVEASIKIGGLGEWTGVGLRFKGYVGSLRICLTPWLWGLECTKLSYKIKFNYKDENQRFFGLKSIQFHASNSDPSMMRERLAYSIYREMGVPAPRQSYSTLRLKFDGEDCATNAGMLGLHILTEVIDGRFTDMHFEKGGNGNLYKEAWPGVSSSQSQEVYTKALKTNKETADVSRLEAWSSALGAAEDDYELAMAVTDFAKANQFARFMAVDRLINNWDGVTNFRGPPFWNHNFFLYSDDGDWSEQQFVPIAWDVDGTFQDGLSDRMEWDEPVCNGGVVPGVPMWTNAKEWPKDYSDCTPCLLHGEEDDPTGLSGTISCFPVMRAFGRGLRSKYMNAAEELIAGPMRPCRMFGKLERWRKIVEPYLIADQEAGIWPSIKLVDGSDADNPLTGKSYDASPEETATELMHFLVPAHRNDFLGSVTCERNYPANAWGDNFPALGPDSIQPMLDISILDDILQEAGSGTWPHTAEYHDENRQICLPELEGKREPDSAASRKMHFPLTGILVAVSLFIERY